VPATAQERFALLYVEVLYNILYFMLKLKVPIIDSASIALRTLSTFHPALLHHHGMQEDAGYVVLGVLVSAKVRTCASQWHTPTAKQTHFVFINFFQNHTGTMKTAVALLALAGSAAAFAPSTFTKNKVQKF